MSNDADLREEVRNRYAEAATTVAAGAGTANDCCHPGKTCAEVGHATGREFYGHLAEEGLPEAAVLASLGCGNPTAVADLHPGETVLDLGSGGGIDVLLSAKRVGPTGKVYGLDMTEEMLALAIKNRDEAGATNVEFLKGYIEDIPLPANTVDVVISNCVINLSTDKSRVLAEMHRVLRPGGRIGISDVVADNELTASQRAEREPTSAVSQARCRSRSTKRASGALGSRTSASSRRPSTCPGSTQRLSGRRSHRRTRSSHLPARPRFLWRAPGCRSRRRPAACHNDAQVLRQTVDRPAKYSAGSGTALSGNAFGSSEIHLR